MFVIKRGELMKVSDFQTPTLSRLTGTQGEAAVFPFFAHVIFCACRFFFPFFFRFLLRVCDVKRNLDWWVRVLLLSVQTD